MMSFSSDTNETFINDSNVRSMDFRDWLSVERFLLQIVREEKNLSDVHVADAEPDLPWEFFCAKDVRRGEGCETKEPSNARRKGKILRMLIMF